jgi:hypothetical protein
MDFALLPPEINSARMYDGAGSGPMLAAAAAWDGLAFELHSAATSYGSVVSGLSAGPWLGAASTAMTAAAGPYVAWVRSTATQAEQTAIQAKAAAAAYEVTFAAMVPPPVIAANRTLLQALVATNLFGQNSPAIAATETLYAEMWAQDATAMYGYAGTSASATTLPPFTPAPQTTTGTSAAASTQAAASQTISTALQGLTSTAASNATSASALSTLSDLAGLILFLPGVAQAGLTPLNTTGLFTDLSFDDDELHFEGLESTDQDILKTFTFNGWKLPPEVTDESLMTRPVMALGPAEGPVGDGGSGSGANGRKVVGAASLDCGGTRDQACRGDTAVHQLGRRPRSHGSQPRNPLQRDDPGKHGQPRHQRHHYPRMSGAHRVDFPLPPRVDAHVAERPRDDDCRRHSRIR